MHVYIYIFQNITIDSFVPLVYPIFEMISTPLIYKLYLEEKIEKYI